MNTSIKSHLVRGAAIVALTALMTGCQHSPSYHHNTTPSTACTSNPYLMKYNCSITRIENAAENGNPDAQYALGYMYYYGINTVRDQQTAELWIQRSAKQGQPLAKKAWSLIDTGATFTDLHQAATDQLTKESQAANTIVQQEPADVEKMNATVPSQPISQVLPAYHSGHSQQKSEPVLDSLNNTENTASTQNFSENIHEKNYPIHDPRLSSNAKPMVAMTKSKGNEQTTLASNSSSAQNSSEKYTVQLMASDRLSDVKAFIAEHNLSAKADYFETQFNSKPWYMLTYGRYDTEQQAESALQNMPTTLLRHHPWVKSFAVVQKEVRLQKVIG